MNKKSTIIIAVLAALVLIAAVAVLSLNLRKAQKTNEEMTQLFEIEKE